LARRGARVVEAPVIAFQDPSSWQHVDDAIARLDTYDWVIFTSANAVERFTQRLRALSGSVAALGRRGVFAIGPATTEALRSHGVPGVMISSVSRAEGLLERLKAAGSPSGRRVLLPRAESARELLPDELRRHGAVVDVVTVYRTVFIPVAREVLEMIDRGEIDIVAFTSGSTVAGLVSAVGDAGKLRGMILAALGPITAEAIVERGLSPGVVAAGAGVEQLAEAISEAWRTRNL
ncbi:MAG TPA: uroporphyrinogen-III synthase, partial [Candidatus Polarisedimenticolia bacterium]|nr:uroporphyrinogen-III synthase [Candidatus Polarisedimenticolia bacterium]